MGAIAKITHDVDYLSSLKQNDPAVGREVRREVIWMYKLMMDRVIPEYNLLSFVSRSIKNTFIGLVFKMLAAVSAWEKNYLLSFVGFLSFTQQVSC